MAATQDATMLGRNPKKQEKIQKIKEQNPKHPEEIYLFKIRKKLIKRLIISATQDDTPCWEETHPMKEFWKYGNTMKEFGKYAAGGKLESCPLYGNEPRPCCCCPRWEKFKVRSSGFRAVFVCLCWIECHRYRILIDLQTELRTKRPKYPESWGLNCEFCLNNGRREQSGGSGQKWEILQRSPRSGFPSDIVLLQVHCDSDHCGGIPGGGNTGKEAIIIIFIFIILIIFTIIIIAIIVGAN